MSIDVKALRKEKGLTQAEMAYLLKCNIKSIQRYENGLSYPRRVYVDILEAIQTGLMDNAIKELKAGKNGQNDGQDVMPRKQDVTRRNKTKQDETRHKQDDIKTGNPTPFNPAPKPHSKTTRKSTKMEVLSGTD